jgi:alginate O-acetyltransferase complex protein AlgI
MAVNSSFFWIFADLIALTPLILLLRAVFPQPAAVRTVLTLTGVYVTFLVGPRFVMPVMFYWVLVWALQLFMGKSAKAPSSRMTMALTALALFAALSPMLAWKAFPEGFNYEANKFSSILLWKFFPELTPSDAMFGFLAPLGLSFAVFRALDLLIKARLGLLEPVSLPRVLYYGFFPSILALGPISEYEEVRLEKRMTRLPDSGEVSAGLFRLSIGAIKIFVVSDAFETISAWAWASGKAPWHMAWVAMLAYAVHFYVNFSGYSDLAIGLARIWGLKLKENFNNPYFKTNPQAFWASWHMSLTRWAQRYVFVPLGGMRKSRQYCAIFATIMIIAMWHGLEWPLVIFGVYHASIAVGHRWFEERQRALGVAKSSSPLVTGLKMLCVFVYVALSIPMFYLSLTDVPVFYRMLLPF